MTASPGSWRCGSWSWRAGPGTAAAVSLSVRARRSARSASRAASARSARAMAASARARAAPAWAWQAACRAVSSRAACWRACSAASSPAWRAAASAAAARCASCRAVVIAVSRSRTAASRAARCLHGLALSGLGSGKGGLQQASQLVSLRPQAVGLLLGCCGAGLRSCPAVFRGVSGFPGRRCGLGGLGGLRRGGGRVRLGAAAGGLGLGQHRSDPARPGRRTCADAAAASRDASVSSCDSRRSDASGPSAGGGAATAAVPASRCSAGCGTRRCRTAATCPAPRRPAAACRSHRACSARRRRRDHRRLPERPPRRASRSSWS